jgi:7-cyano-7-deazaguanine synthase in queuosine biosynthesis
MGQLHLDVKDDTIDGKQRRITRLTLESGAMIAEIFHEFSGIKPLTPDTLLDGHVLALLLAIMKQGGTLHVHGPMSVAMLRNLEELQLVWQRWRPDTYHHVDIVPDRLGERKKSTRRPRAIAAFSGGADSTFTALRHTKVLNENVRYPLTDVMMVHGFDVELQYPHYFERLTQRVQPLLADLGLKLHTIRTNSKNWDRQDWLDSHGLELAACLHMFADDFQFGLIGSCEPYDSMCTPWGSGPVTDHLMSGDRFKIVHDGAGFSRTDKINEIGKHPVACRTLKVCWAGADQSDNCGHCEKCTRTMLNFLACGYPVPPCFPDGLRPRDVRAMKIYNGPQMSALANIIAYAKSHNVTGPWIKWVNARMKRGFSSYSPCLARRALSQILNKCGLKEPIKKLLIRLHRTDLIWH